MMAHPWFKGYKLKDIQQKKIEPPYKPCPTEFNLDEDELVKNKEEEREFKRLLQEDRDFKSVLSNFYYEREN